MGTADNLNLDCLELICAHLSGNDLVSVSLVSRSFLAAVLPQLYRTLTFHLGNAKRSTQLFLTAFDVINLHPHLAVHVLHIDIRIAPLIKGVLSPKFAISCRNALSLCTNLKSLICLPPNLLTPLLPTLGDCASLESIRLNATLTVEQCKILTSFKTLKTLALDGASWNTVDMLPLWASSLSSTLTCLILHGVQELNEQILKAMLPNVPRLQGLHVVGCPKIEHTTVLQELSVVPALQSLSITAWDCRTLPTRMPALSNLRHLTIDTHLPPPVAGHPDTMPQIWQFIFSHNRRSSFQLSSIYLRLSDKMMLSGSLVKDLISSHGSNLQTLFLLNCELEISGLQSVAARCKKLEKLAVKVPLKDVSKFSGALHRSKSLKVLHDMTEVHTHGTQAYLSKSNVRMIMDEVPTLNTIVSSGRTWTRVKEKSGSGTLTVERRKNSCRTYWFLPQ